MTPAQPPSATYAPASARARSSGTATSSKMTSSDPSSISHSPNPVAITSFFPPVSTSSSSSERATPKPCSIIYSTFMAIGYDCWRRRNLPFDRLLSSGNKTMSRNRVRLLLLSNRSRRKREERVRSQREVNLLDRRLCWAPTDRQVRGRSMPRKSRTSMILRMKRNSLRRRRCRPNRGRGK